MRHEPGVALQPLAIALKACQELQGSRRLTMVEGGPFGRPAFCGAWAPHAALRGARVGAAEPPPGCRTVFLLRHCGHLPHRADAIGPIFVVYKSSAPAVSSLCRYDSPAEPEKLARGDAVLRLRRRAEGGLGVSAAEDFAPYKLHFVDDIQQDYEVIRPIVLLADTVAEGSRQTGLSGPS